MDDQPSPSLADRHGSAAPFVCHFSQWRVLQFAFLAAVMTALSYWCTTRPEPKAIIAGWAGLALFGIGSAIALPRAILHRGPALVIDETGIEDLRGKLGKIPWSETTRVWVGIIERQKFLCVAVVDESPYAAKLSRVGRLTAAATRSMGFPLCTITFKGTDRRIEDAVKYIEIVAPHLLASN